MRKSWFCALILMVMLLAACSPQALTPESLPPTLAAAEPTTTPADLQPTDAAPALVIPTSVPATCSVVSKQIVDPTFEAVFPPVTDADWVKGDDKALVTILEYSDYQ